jgi:hypothetical protein
MPLQQTLFLVASRRRGFGGYIEDAQLAMLGQELYKDIHGSDALVPRDFVVPFDDDGFTSNLHGYELGKAVVKHNLQGKDAGGSDIGGEVSIKCDGRLATAGARPLSKTKGVR